MESNSFLNPVFKYLYWLQALFILVASALAGSAQADPKWLELHADWLVKPHYMLLQWVWLAWILTISVGIIEAVRRYIGPPWIWQCIHDILDAYRSKVFIDVEYDLNHHHRVTLFQHKKIAFQWCVIPRFNMLVPMERSGWTNRRFCTWFKAPDNADEAQGVAGMIWATGNTLTLENLPEIDKRQIITNKSVIQEYADKTWSEKSG